MSEQPKPIDDGGSAFPCPTTFGGSGEVAPGFSGMTLRDHFAGMALQGKLAQMSGSGAMMAMINQCTQEGWDMPTLFAAQSYAYADAMIAERNKR